MNFYLHQINVAEVAKYILISLYYLELKHVIVSLFWALHISVHEGCSRYSEVTFKLLMVTRGKGPITERQ